jgi:DeoR/GlpR family transcriptional regulator of sugar metabolism
MRAYSCKSVQSQASFSEDCVLLTTERKQRLIAILRDEGRIVAKDCAASLGLSEDTIRRDLRELAAEGQLQRVHGGALPASRATEDLASRGSISMPEKKALARIAAAQIKRGQVIFLDGGTTTLELVRCLDRALRVTIVTHSPSIAAALIDHRADVQLIGGRLFKHSMVAVGAAAADAIRKIRADIYFMGLTGIEADHGASTGDAEEAVIKRTIAECSGEVVVMASTEKVGAVSPFLIMPAQAVTHLIVPDGVASRILRPLRKLGIEITIASGKA